MVTVFKEDLNLELPITFYRSIRWFVFERGFVSEPLAENRLGSLLEIIDKFITNLNAFSHDFAIHAKNSLGSFITILYDFINTIYIFA